MPNQPPPPQPKTKQAERNGDDDDDKKKCAWGGKVFCCGQLTHQKEKEQISRDSKKMGIQGVFVLSALFYMRQAIS